MSLINRRGTFLVGLEAGFLVGLLEAGFLVGLLDTGFSAGLEVGFLVGVVSGAGFFGFNKPIFVRLLL